MAFQFNLRKKNSPIKVGIRIFIAKRRSELLNAVTFLTLNFKKKNIAAPSRIPRSANEIGRTVFANMVAVVAVSAVVNEMD